MLAAMRSADDVHVRALLDQRAQRADVPATRFSAFSDRSDSPSLYSHVSNNHPRSPRAFPISPLSHSNDYHDTATSPPQQHLYARSPNHRFDDPNASELDLSDDRSLDEYRSSVASHPHEPLTADGDYTAEDDSIIADADTSLESRLSLMGPKMRVHSRAPWEDDDQPDRDSLLDDGGADTLSIFGGKSKTPKFAMMRGLAFGSKSPVPRKSSDSASTSRGKASFETSSGSSITTGGAIQVLAQASMSTTSLAAFPNHLLVPRPVVGRERSLSISSAGSGSDPHPPLPSFHPAVLPSRSSGAVSPFPEQHQHQQRQLSLPSPSRPSHSSERSDSPPPFQSERKGASVHPYANPAHLKPYDRTSFIDPFGQDPDPDPDISEPHAHMPSKESSATLTSEETVTLSHSMSTATTSAFSSSTADLASSTSATSKFSSFSDLSVTHGDDLHSRTMKLRRETKLGPVGQPTGFIQTPFPSSAPYTLISLEQAQEKAKLRNRSATMDEASVRKAAAAAAHSPYPASENDPMPSFPTPRMRTTSGSSKLKYVVGHVAVDGIKGDSGPASPVLGSVKQAFPAGAKVVKQKRSGFLKLFNSKERQVEEQPPPVPTLHDTRYLARTPEPHVSPSYQPHQTTKHTLHRVPVPAFAPALPANVSHQQGDTKTKKSGQPALSIKVISPPSAFKAEKPAFSTNSLNVDSLYPFKAPASQVPTSAPPTTSNFGLSVRPVSSFFESTFADQLAPEVTSAGSSGPGDMLSSITSPSSYSSDGISPTSINSLGGMSLLEKNGEDDPGALIAALKERIISNRKIYQQQFWELEGQIRDLKQEVHQLKDGEKCETCGRGIQKPVRHDSSGGVIHRPRAKTGTGARFASGNDC